jgi:hypothetical protein
VISPHITDEFDESDTPSEAQAPTQLLPRTVFITPETDQAITARAEELGKTPAELAGLLLSCAVMLWRAGDAAE